jgi:hypothetical protein
VNRRDLTIVSRGKGDSVTRHITVHRTQNSLQIALDLVEALVKDHGAVVTDVDLDPSGMGTFTVRVPCRSGGAA